MGPENKVGPANKEAPPINICIHIYIPQSHIATGTPAEGPEGWPPAEGPGVGAARTALGHRRRRRRGAGGGIDQGGDTLKGYTKPRKTIQSPERLDKAP